MLGGLLKSTSRLALIAAAGLAVGGIASAQAADLGGDCCADLEERVAELEATTARKGNRKVSLTVYGQITTAVMWWDNGKESNTYVTDPQTSGTRFGLRGSAQITPDWEAGYNLELQWQTADWTRVRANDDEGLDAPEFRQSYWYLKSKTLGRISVGRQDTANSSIAEIDLSAAYIADGMSSSQAGEAIIEDMLGVALGTYTNFEFNRQDVVRYDTPTIAGFIASASWGEDDIWDVALRYAGEFGGFKIAAGIAYGEETDSTSFTERRTLNGGLSIMHVPTGLFASGSAGRRETDDIPAPIIGRNDIDEDFWHVVGGIEQKWNSLGKTTLFGMGGHWQRDVHGVTVLLTPAADQELRYWGGGIVQQLDAAAMELWVSYRHYDVDRSDGPFNQDFDVVTGGGRIKF